MKLFTMLINLVGFLSAQRAEVYHNGSNNVQSSVVFPDTIQDTVSFDTNQCDYVNVHEMEKEIDLNGDEYYIDGNATENKNKKGFLTKAIEKVNPIFSWIEDLRKPATSPTQFQLWFEKTAVEVLNSQAFFTGLTFAARAGIVALGVAILLKGASNALMEASMQTKFCLGMVTMVIAQAVIIYSANALWDYAYKPKNKKKKETVAENVFTEVATKPTLTHTSAPDALAPEVENVVKKVEEHRPADISAEQPQKVFAPAFERQLSPVTTVSATMPQLKLSVLEQAEAARKNSQEQAELRLDNTREALESTYRAVIA